MKKKAKKVIKKKKVVKKTTTKKKAKKVEQSVQAIVPISQIIRPEVHKGKYSLIPTSFTETQLKMIVAPTPREVIKIRPGKGGGTWEYVPGWYFKKKLNFVFGFNWDFEILGERVDGDYITVKGKLVIRHTSAGDLQASKVDYGGSEIKYLKNKPHKPENYLDISNNFKAAATDALKRCCVQLGFCMDVYGKNEAKNDGYTVRNDEPEIEVVDRKKDSPMADHSCYNCLNPLTPQEAQYSKHIFKKELCRDCQKLAKDGALTLK